MSNRTVRARGFSLIELVIVVVIIGIIAAIAVPRMSRGVGGAADASLTANLAVLRNALDLFYTEHGNTYPVLSKVDQQLLLYSDDSGAVNASKDATHIFGPYLRAIPPLPIGANKGQTGFTDTLGSAGSGWCYDQTSGKVQANTTPAEVDSRGVKYSEY